MRSAATIDHGRSAAAGSVTARTRGRYCASSVAAGIGSAATTIPVTSWPASAASVRASVATSVEMRASDPSAVTSPITR